ncbi:hypothetical protein EJ03DRAFT_91009 [Teratosphaeria nubilosa]|uniref:Uncharacterized protein n=1 Tax=Teratosphaeria nubilosa TaxID=161662 RepID=A0A6G1LBQ6_9PEZI|nr:hypothetical protein EJ03DRAFT_91009 [Teratosphaeria nubilosa]
MEARREEEMYHTLAMLYEQCVGILPQPRAYISLTASLFCTHAFFISIATICTHFALEEETFILSARRSSKFSRSQT